MSTIILSNLDTTTIAAAVAADPTFKYMKPERKQNRPLLDIRDLCRDAVNDPNSVAKISLITSLWFQHRGRENERNYPIMWEMGGGDTRLFKRGKCIVIGDNFGNRVAADRTALIQYNRAPNHVHVACPASVGTVFAVGNGDGSDYVITVFRVTDRFDLSTDDLARFSIPSDRTYVGINAELIAMDLIRPGRPDQGWQDPNVDLDLRAIKAAAFAKMSEPSCEAIYIERFVKTHVRDAEAAAKHTGTDEGEVTYYDVSDPNAFYATLRSVHAKYRERLKTLGGKFAFRPIPGSLNIQLRDGEDGQESLTLTYLIPALAVERTEPVEGEESEEVWNDEAVATVLTAETGIPADILTKDGALCYRQKTFDDLLNLVKANNGSLMDPFYSVA